jgi:hypothetical protein
VAILEPYRVVILVPHSRGDARTFLRKGRPGAARHVSTPEPSPAG